MDEVQNFRFILATILVISLCTCCGTTDSGTYHYCNTNANFTEGSHLQQNLNNVMFDLVNGVSLTGFNISVSGNTTDNTTAYGMAECRADISTSACRSCIIQANLTLLRICGTATGGRIWFSGCFLRWETFNFTGELDENGWYSVDTAKVSSSPDNFSITAKSLLKNLSHRPENISSGHRFAAGYAPDSTNPRTVYGFVQCWQDISAQDCGSCLAFAVDFLVKNCYGKTGGRMYLASCIVGFDTQSFFSPSAIAPSSAESESPPSGGSDLQQAPPPDSSGHRYRVSVISAIVSVTLMML